jgi:hypothetical protein
MFFPADATRYSGNAGRPASQEGQEGTREAEPCALFGAESDLGSAYWEYGEGVLRFKRWMAD